MKTQKRKIKKIAMVYFPINNVGGIITWNKEIQKGLRLNGVEPMYFYLTPGVKIGCDPEKDILKDRYTMIAGYHLSYGDRGLSDTLEILNSFDAVMFTKISPHPTKDNLNRKGIENWVELYRQVKVPKIVVFHDAMWRETNEWCDLVADEIDICLAAQKKFLPSVENYPAKCFKYWDYFPMDFEPINKLDLSVKENFGMVATQWLGWKNHAKFIPLLGKVKVPIRLFGFGIEWYYLRKTEEYKKFVDEGEGFKYSTFKINNRSIHKMIGQVDYPTLQKYYARALFSIDLSTRGYTNYTHFEPLAYRVLSFIESRVCDDQDNIIPADCCVRYDFDQLPEVINRYKGIVTSKEIRETLDRGQKFIQRFNTVEVAKRLIENLEAL